MKKKLLTLAIMLLSVCIFTTKTFAQTAPGDNGGTGIDNGTTGTAPDPGTAGGGNIDLVINLGPAGSITIPSTSPYYSSLSAFLTTCHVSGSPITTPCVHSTCFFQNLLSLFSTKCITYKTLGTCQTKQSTCNTVPRTCNHY